MALPPTAPAASTPAIVPTRPVSYSSNSGLIRFLLASYEGGPVQMMLAEQYPGQEEQLSEGGMRQGHARGVASERWTRSGRYP